MADRARHGIPEQILASIDDGIPAVQAIREWRDLGIYALARRSGVPARRIGRYEAKRAPLSNEELMSIAVALRVPAEVLLAVPDHPGPDDLYGQQLHNP